MATSMIEGLHISENSRLNFDDSGFLVGQRRLEQNVKSVAENTHEILELLKAQLKARELNPPEHQLSAFQKALIEASRRATIDTTTQLARQQRSTNPRAVPQRPTRDTDQQATNRPAANNSVISRRPTVDVQSPADLPKRQANDTSNSSQSTPTRERTRDAKGRFIGEGGENGTGSDSNWLERVKNSIQSGVKDGLHTDVRGVDPTVDAINELSTLLSPVGKAASFTLRPLNAMLRGRKRNEPIPREEAQHNREQIRLLRRIADQNGNNAGMGAGMGKVAIGMITAVARRFPVIAAVLGIKGLLDESDKNRPAEQGDTNPDGTSNEGEVGALNRMSKNTMNAVRGAGNAVNSALGGDADYFDDGTAIDSKNQVGLKSYLSRLIGSHEGGNKNPYSAFNRGVAGDSIGKSIDFSKLTVGELLNLGKLPQGHKDRVFAAGKYQITTAGYDEKRKKRTEGTLGEAITALGISRNEKFTPELQERIFNEFLVGSKRPAVQAYRSGESNDLNGALYELSKEFASFPVPKGYLTKSGRKSNGRSGFYDNDSAGNKASVKIDDVIKALNLDRQQKGSKPVVQPDTKPTIQKMAQDAGLDKLSYNRLNTNPAKPTQKAAIIPFKPTNARTAPQLTPLSPIPSIKESLSSKPPQVVQLASSSDNIGQNVADRDIAHSVTGGLGARTWEG